MNQSDIYHDMNQTAYDAWVYSELQPDENLFMGRRIPKNPPAWTIPFPDHLIPLAPEEIDQQERDRRNDEYLKLNGYE